MSDFKTGIGIMSGTSLDGLDLVCCRFMTDVAPLRFGIVAARTIPYSSEWRTRLTFNEHISGYDLKLLDIELGTFIGEQVAAFISEENLQPDFVSSHGHTWFHDPANRLNYQLGDGYEIYRKVGIPVVNDFRSLDIRHGGQGAPLVPIGDHLLFSGYDCCVNLGGIANVSGLKDQNRVSYDVMPFNMVLNSLAREAGHDFDAGGNLARSGKMIESLKEALGSLTYFSEHPPKSLGVEWVQKEVFPIINSYHNHPVEDRLHTYVDFSCEQLIAGFSYFDASAKILVTGGGAHNSYFIESLKDMNHGQMIVPGTDIVDYKEALIFAFLGKLRLENKINCLKDVTGADFSVSGGLIYDQLTER